MPNLIAQYKLNDNAGNTTVVDSSTNGYNGTASSNTSTLTTTGKINEAFSLTTSDSVDLGTGSQWDFGTNNFSISLWFKIGSVGSERVILTKRDWVSASEDGYAIALVNATTIRVHYYDDNDFTVSSIADDNWHHIVVNFDYTNSETALYLDGSLNATKSHTQDSQSNANNLYIGRNQPNSVFFDGELDDIRFYDDELSSDEVDVLYNNGSGTELGLDVREVVESVTVNDSLTSPDFRREINETITINEQSLVFPDPEKIANIISYNPLIYVMDTDPAYIVHVDTTTPANPTFTPHEIVGCKNAKDVVLNDNSDYFFVICAEGKVAKIAKADLSSQTVISTGDADNLINVSSLQAFNKTYISTDDSSGEIIMIDESEVSKVNTDIRFLNQLIERVNTFIDFIFGKTVNSDLRFLYKTAKKINSDIRFLRYAFTELSQNPISYDDLVVKVNGTDLCPLDDVNLKSVRIIHTVDEKSQAEFILNRRHDNLDFTNTGASSQITNQNAISIEIDGVVEFSGNISALDTNSEAEQVTVFALSTQPSTKSNSVQIPMSSLDTDLHLYDCLVNNVSIENPVLDTKAVIANSSGLFWTGSDWTGDIDDAKEFNTHTLAQNEIDAKTELNQFDSDQVFPINHDEDVSYFKGVQVNLGKQIEQNVLKYSSFTGTSSLATKIEQGSFTPKQSWSYFWFAQVENFINTPVFGSSSFTTGLRYIGTSLGSLSADSWRITGASYKYQKILADTETDLGWYYLGSAPYQIITSRNGRKNVEPRWEDKFDGLYLSKDDRYDYVQYAKDIASLEYSKLKNINGQILPVTDVDLDITLNGYYFYNLGLLSKVNVINTTTANIYKNTNGFPVSIKSITIDFSTGKVSLNCDNQLSLRDLKKIDKNRPDENSDEYITKASSVKHYSKYSFNESSEVK